MGMDSVGGCSLSYQKIDHCIYVKLVPAVGDQAASAMMQEMVELCDRIAWDEEVRVAVIEFGGEINASLATPVAKLKQPVIAAIRGNAVGAGLELALACDIRIGTEDGLFGLPQVSNGYLPANGGTQRLPRIIGRGRAMELILTGRLIDATEALKIGLIHRAVAQQVLEREAMSLAQEMALKSPLSLNYAKEAVYSGMDMPLDQGLKMEMDLYLLLFGTRDRVEGITAFKEKRTPKFEGT